MTQKNQIDIIMFAMSSFSDWRSGIQNRNFHILNSLQKDCRVRKILVVDFLPFTFKKAVKTYINDIILSKHGGDIVYGDLICECHQHTSKIYNYSTVASIINEKIVINEIKKIIKVLDLHNIVLWSYNPMYVKSFKNLGEKLIVFDTVDNWINHSSYTNYTGRLKQNYNIISKQSDIIFTVAKNLIQFYKTFKREKETYFLPNGINTGDFNYDRIYNSKPVEFFEKNKLKDKKIIGYIGIMQKDRFDVDLMQYVTRQHPDKNFVLAGPVWKETEREIKSKFKGQNNVFFPGMVQRKFWIDYCNYFDVAINPHKHSEFIKYTSPTKVFEYFSCGKPVVSTNVSGVDDFKDMIYIADNKEEFSRMLNTALLEDTKEKQEARIDYGITNFSWDKRAGEMLELVIRRLER